jgi:polyether ionophore transport system ATP-binding protein
MTVAVATAGLVKTFGRTRALDGLDLSVGYGQVHGFLGPNGAGKTTAIRILLGLLRADAGQVTLLGGDPWADAVALHRRLVYVPGEVTLWPKVTGGEVIDLVGRLRGDLDHRRRDELLERFELDPTKKARTYSKGNRQKVALVASRLSCSWWPRCSPPGGTTAPAWCGPDPARPWPRPASAVRWAWPCAYSAGP